MITRFQRCVGLRLLRIFKWQLEVWFCPPYEPIPNHVHKECDSRIIHIWGTMLWWVPGKCKIVTSRNIGWSKPVPANMLHGAYTYSYSIFANWQRWNTKPTSAAIDFHQ